MNLPFHRIIRVALCSLAFPAVATAAEIPSGFVEEKLADGIDAATTMCVAPDGRVFFAEQFGALRVWKDGRVLPAPALDLADRLDTMWERGLIGITLHPDFPRTPHAYIVYVAKSPFTHQVVSRFTLTGNVIDPASEKVLFTGDDQAKFTGKLPTAHQGAPLRFGPDGCLYIAFGEQTAGAPSQALDTLLGKVLRIHPDGSIPEDNPFHSQTTGNYRAIWALGFRNPFGLAFQPGTGRLFETDVGQSSWDEVNEVVRGGNYGWPEAEGMSKDPRFRNPIHTYPPVVGRCVVGAAFSPREGTWPEKWRGKLFFADWASHWVKALDPDAPENPLTFGRNFVHPVALEFAPDGSLLVLNRGTIWNDPKKIAKKSGSLVRIRHTGLTTGATTAAPVPRTLSAAAVFASLSPLTPRDSFTAFEINAPPWQPGIRARRWISLPAGKRLGFSTDGEWKFPDGAVLVQHYELERDGAPFETQVLVFDGPRTARAAAYRWSAAASDATLAEDAQIVPLPGSAKRFWFSPGVERHLDLDTVITGFLVPVNTRQLNRIPSGGGKNQLEAWNERGWFDPPLPAGSLPRLAALDDTAAAPELRVRSYFDVNCAACHRPGGLARGGFDARFVTPLAQQGLLNGELIAGDLGIAGAKVIVPGSLEKSALLHRVKPNPFFRMPPVSVNDEPQPVLPVLEEWIRSLK